MAALTTREINRIHEIMDMVVQEHLDEGMPKPEVTFTGNVKGHWFEMQVNVEGMLTNLWTNGQIKDGYLNVEVA